jgi:hypothetical protein
MVFITWTVFHLLAEKGFPINLQFNNKNTEVVFAKLDKKNMPFSAIFLPHGANSSGFTQNLDLEILRRLSNH